MADMTDEEDDIEAEFDDDETERVGPDAEDEPDEAEFEEAGLEELDEEDLDVLEDDLDTEIDVEIDADLDDPGLDTNGAGAVPSQVEPARPRVRAADESDEDEEEEESDDVEADLDTILKDRLATHEDEEDEEEGEAQVVITDDGELPQRKEFEFPCPSCFLLVNAKTVRRTGSCPQCGDPIEVPAGIG